AYENSIFCETFHSEESGWRECKFCGKLVHCGCIASRYLYEFMDFGGIGCGSCAKRIELQSGQTLQVVIHIYADGRSFSSFFFVVVVLSNAIGITSITSAFEQHKLENEKQRMTGLSEPYTPSIFLGNRAKQGPKNIYETLAHSPLNFSLSSPSSNSALPFHGKIGEGSEPSSKASFKARLPKLPKQSILSGGETNKGSGSQGRVPRPPAEIRGRNQLLPRYWPRITDQELQQLSGDLKSTIVPLFEKILSASDAGRIGRLVLPKACAEAYFPSINQSEGIPIKIQDVKGKEWTFQFRFWPNNNSRMYVLEGVTPCIQNMQLQAGDTVIFSRRDPGGQLVIGCRKATNKFELPVIFFRKKKLTVTSFAKDPLSPAVLHGDASTEALLTSSADKLPSVSGEDSPRHTEKKKSKNIKNKRLLMHNDDAVELRITWEEAQELFRPSSSVQPTVVLVEGHEFEEFEEPPLFGKRTVFISQPSGEQEQLAQCDNCFKWRRLPANALLVANWTCSNNIWDSSRCSCSVPEEMNPRDLDFRGGVSYDNKKQRNSDAKVASEMEEPTGLEALATAAVLGDNVDVGESSASATTRHPRHRPGCSCIVCIQPPSGKGKHEPTCKCNVCLTVRRRFKTLMMRKKKRQAEDPPPQQQPQNASKASRVESRNESEEAVVGKKSSQLDLNCDP
ncbi:hypothetical protein M569_10291, partial [Genlisea aurea]